MIKVKGHPGIYYRLGVNGEKTYYLRIISGGRQTWRACGPRLQDANALRHRLKVERAGQRLGISVPRKSTFNSLADDYLSYYQTKARESNWSRVRSIFRPLRLHFGSMDISAINSWTAESYIRKRQKAHPAARTINQELIYLTAALNKAVEWGRLEAVPRIKKLPTFETRARILSDAELGYILANVSEAHRDAILIALDTGMRLGEIYSLRPGDIDGDTIHLEDTKSRKTRSIPMTPQVRDIIARRFRECGGRLFHNSSDRAIALQFLYERGKLKGIAPWRFHDLRHTFCTRLLQKGVDPFTVMKLSGHSKLEMVTRYLHTDDDLKRAAIGKLAPRLKTVHTRRSPSR